MRLIAATLLLCLALPVVACAPQKVAAPKPPGQEKSEVLLPPAGAKEAGKEKLPQSISRRPPPPEAPPAPRHKLPAPVESAPLESPGGPLPPTTVISGRIAVGLLVPLTGPQGDIGRAILNAAEMALFDIAADNFTLLPRDTGGTPEGAAAAASDVLGSGAKLILGPLLAADVSAVAPVARAANVPVVAFSTDASVAGDGIFLMGLLPREQVVRVVTFAAKRGHKNFAALIPDNAYGGRVYEGLLDATAQTGTVLTDAERFTPGADATETVRRLANYAVRRAALESQIRELEAKDDEPSRQALARLKQLDALGDVSFDAVMLADGGENLRAIAPLLPYYDIDTRKVQLLGTSLWNDPSLGTEPALVGGWFAAPDPTARMEFNARYAALTGQKPHGLATLGYDSTALAAVLARSDSGPDFSVTALTAESGYAGVDGIFRFLPDGLSQRGLAVLEMQRNEFRVLDPAPSEFPKIYY